MFFVCPRAPNANSQDRGDEGYQVSDHALSKMVISTRGKWWAQQGLRAQQECWQRARQHHTDKAAEIREEAQALEAALDALLNEEKEIVDRHPSLTMSSAAVADDDLRFFQQCMECKQHCSPSRLAALRCTLTEGPPPLADVPDSKDIAVWCRREPDMPKWAAMVVKYRGFVWLLCTRCTRGERTRVLENRLLCAVAKAIHCCVRDEACTGLPQPTALVGV